MKLSNLLRRSLAMLLLLAMMMSFVPNVFAAQADGQIDDEIVIEIPNSLKDEDIVTATFGEDGEIVYNTASDDVRSAINGGLNQGTYADVTNMLTDRAGSALSKGQRLAFFIDPSNSEGNANYKTFTLDAAKVKALVAAGVTDLFVMTKTQEGTSKITSDLKVAYENRGTAKVYAWVHCAYDWAYLKNNHSAAQYHIRRGYSNKRTDNANSNEGYVHLADTGYITYMQNFVKSAAQYADGLLLDSVRFGTEFTGWGSDMKAYYVKKYSAATYNEAFKAVCATAYTDVYGNAVYKYKADSDGYYVIDDNGSLQNTTGSTVADCCTNNTAAAQALGAYRQYVISEFIGKMKTAFCETDSNRLVAVALDKQWTGENFHKYVLGQHPDSYKNHVKNGFTVTMRVGSGTHSDSPEIVAQTVAAWTNVMIGVDFYKVSSNSNNTYGYSTAVDSMVKMAKKIHKLRYDNNGQYSLYRGSILGAACYTMGHVGAQKIVLSSITSTEPTLTVTVVNPNQSTSCMLGRFNRNGNTNCVPGLSDQYNVSALTSSITLRFWYQSAGYIVANTGYAGAAIGAFEGRTFKVKLSGYTKNWEELPFARLGFFVEADEYDNSIVSHYPIHVVSGHETCTSFTESVLVTASCTTVGYKRMTCNTCGYDYIEEYGGGEHAYTLQSETKPTCTTEGSKVYKCSKCSSTKTETVAALQHNYQPVVVASTCVAKGYTKYVCANDASHNYIDESSYKPLAAHTFVDGVCSVCRYSPSKLLHFKEGSVETIWPWGFVGGAEANINASIIKTGDGILYSTSNGLRQAYFANNSGKIDYTIAQDDIVQIRIRVKRTESATLTEATPTIRFELKGDTGFGTTVSADSKLDLTTDEWQIINFPISGYDVGDTIYRIRIDPFGSALTEAMIEIDYIHFGAKASTPIKITFENDDHTVLQTTTVAPGSQVTYYGETPTKLSSAGFVYTFSGWSANSATMDDVFITDLSTVLFVDDTVLTAQYTAERVTDPDPIASNKVLIDSDGNPDDYKYDIQIDLSTYGKEVTIKNTYNQPLDIMLIIDRSASIAYPATYSNSTRFTATYTAPTTTEEKDGKMAGNSTQFDKLEAYVNDNFKKDKPVGYYVASNFLGISYVGTSADPYGQGCTSYEAMKFDEEQGWMVWQTMPLYDDTLYKGTAKEETWTGSSKIVYKEPWASISGIDCTSFLRPGSVLLFNDNFSYQQQYYQGNSSNSGKGILGKWVTLEEAYYSFYRRLTASVNADDITTPWATMKTVYFRVGVSRRGLIQEAMNKFVNDLYTSNSKLPEGQYHTVKVVSYGYGVYTQSSYTYNDLYTVSKDLGVTTAQITLNSTTNRDKILTAINKPYAFGSTYTNYAFQYAAGTGESGMPSGKLTTSSGRQPVIILMTDGSPTYGSSFETDVANSALAEAQKLKSQGYKIFSVGFMSGLNSNTDRTETWSDSAAESSKANDFLHLISSNYTNATTMDDTSVTLDEKPIYYMSSNAGDNLISIFESIFTQVNYTTDVQTQIKEPVKVMDIVTKEWNVPKIDGKYDVTISRADYLGDGQFAEPVEIASTIVTNTDKSVSYVSTEKITGEINKGEAVYVLKPMEVTSGETRFDLTWNDAPNAWLREKMDVTDGSTYYGYKLIMTIGIELDRNVTMGGNNIPTNQEGSGVFYDANPNLNHEYKVPTVNVEVNVDYVPHDFFLDLYNEAADFDYLDILAAEDQTSYIREIFRRFYTRKVEIKGDNEDLDIQFYAGDEVFFEELKPGTTTWTETFKDVEFDFLKDQEIPIGYIVQPLEGELDSLGRKPFDTEAPKVVKTTVNYYAPKFAIVDYDADVIVEMGNETPSLLKMTIDNNGVFSNDDVIYTFRYDADSTTEEQHLLNGTEVINYTVVAKNTPYKASSNEISRKIHIIPANIVEYDQTHLKPTEYVVNSGYKGNWIEEGSEDATAQKVNNLEAQGYDSALLASGADDNYSYGTSYITTVADNVRNDSGNIAIYKNNNALEFTFKGTGFDVISQTGPKEGIMIVEVYAVDGTTVSSDVTVRYMVDNYLATKTLYQIPVVRCTDLAHGTYKVVIRAFYNQAFNHFYEPKTGSDASNVMTEARIRQILGLSEDDVLEYTLSNERGMATRAMTSTSYDIHVDGVRIYNTLGTDMASKNPIEYALYGAEANAEFSNARDLLFDSKSWLQNDENTPGVVYIAGAKDDSNDTVDSDDVDYGLHLSSSGILAHEKVVENNITKCYILDLQGKRIKHPTHQSDIYFKMNPNETIVSIGAAQDPIYFYKNQNGGEALLTAKQLRAIVGQGNLAFYNSSYDVNSPKNEVYLPQNSGIAFKANNATLLQISFNALEGTEATLQAYDWTNKKFVTIAGSTKNAMAMYYDLLPYVDTDGTVVIKNTGSNIAVVSSIKIAGENAELTAPASVVVKGVGLLQGTYEPEITLDEELELSTSISVGAEMQIVYTILAENVAPYSDFYVEITKQVANGEPVVTKFTFDSEEYPIRTIVKPNTDQIVGYQIVYTGIHAMEIGDEFTAVLYGVDEYGLVYCGEVFTDSIQNYLMERIEDEASSDALKTLAVDMLNYGAAAQLYFGYDVENLANAKLTDEQKAYATQAIPEAKNAASMSGEGIKLSADVSLKSKVVLYLTCMYASNENSNLKFVVKDAQGNILDESAPSFVNAKACQGSYANVGAAHMRELLTIELYDNDVLVSKTLTWSVESYVAATRESAASSEALINAVNAMLVYGDSAAVFLAQTGQ